MGGMRSMATLALLMVLLAEKGKLFGHGEAAVEAAPIAVEH